MGFFPQFAPVCTIAKKGSPTDGNPLGAGNEFYLDGIRVMQPLNEMAERKDLVEKALEAYTIDGESIPLMNGFIGPDADYGTLGAFELNSGSEEDAMGIAWGMDEGQYIFSIYDAYTSIEMGYIQETENEALVYLNMDESGTVMEISANVSVSTGEMAAADLVKLAQGGFVDVMTAGDAEYEQVAQDLTTVGMSAAMTVAANVPDLMMMLMGE